MINRVVAVGRLVKDPILRKTQEGTSVTSFTIAVNDRFSDNVNFFDCVAWGKTADFVSEYTKKGHLIGVDGRLQQRSYEKDMQKFYVTEIVAESVQSYQPKDKDEPKEKAQPEVVQVKDDDLPF